MIIPIPANNERFTIALTLRAIQRVSLGIRVYDPDRPNTHYFRRKAQLQQGQQRQLFIPLAVSADFLELELYDKQSPEDEVPIALTNFTIQKMPPVQVWMTPERRRFLEFAISFAQKAGYTPTGFYDSPKGEFLFQYLPSITDAEGKELITPARISRKMPRVQLSQRLFKTFTIPVRVFILAHEGCHWFLNTRSEKTADLCGIRQYLDYGFPKIEAVYAATKIFSLHPVGTAQLQRTKDIMAFIDDYKQLSA